MPNEHQRASKMQPKTNNSEKLATPGTQDTRRRQTKQKQQIYLQRNDTWNIFCYFFSFICLVFFFKIILIMSICTDENL